MSLEGYCLTAVERLEGENRITSFWNCLATNVHWSFTVFNNVVIIRKHIIEYLIVLYNVDESSYGRN